MTALHPILALLQGGDRRSIGKADEAVAKVLRTPALFEPLFSGLHSDDPLIRMRSADAVEKITADNPELLKPHKKALLTTLARSDQQEVKWHIAALIPRLPLTKTEKAAAVEILRGYTGDKSAIVKTMAMQALHDLARADSALKPLALKTIRELTATGTPAMKARGRKLLVTL